MSANYVKFTVTAIGNYLKSHLTVTYKLHTYLSYIYFFLIFFKAKIELKTVKSITAKKKRRKKIKLFFKMNFDHWKLMSIVVGIRVKNRV